MENQNTYKSVRLSCPSLLTAWAATKKQIEYDSFTVRKKINAGRIISKENPQVGEISLVMAEMWMLPEGQEIKINKETLTVGVVREVYGLIKREHVEFVLENFKNVTEKVFNTKAYLRTALYNSVFEMESSYGNQVKSDLGGGL